MLNALRIRLAEQVLFNLAFWLLPNESPEKYWFADLMIAYYKRVAPEMMREIERGSADAGR